MKQIGTVVSVSGDTAVVEVRRASACGENCAQCKGGCAPAEHRAVVKNTAGAVCGDRVRIELADSAVLKSACMVYLLPIFVMFLCLGLAEAIAENAAVSVFAAVLGLAVSFLLLRTVDRKVAKTPEITEIIYREREES